MVKKIGAINIQTGFGLLMCVYSIWDTNNRDIVVLDVIAGGIYSDL